MDCNWGVILQANCLLKVQKHGGGMYLECLYKARARDLE